jgi:hypothetical protein
MAQDSICCYVGCSNAHVYVYNLRSRHLLQILTHHNSPVNDLYVSTDDCFLFSAAEVCSLCFCTLDIGNKLIDFRMQYMS